MSASAEKELVYGGTAIGGYSVGILTLDTTHALLPGNIQHAASFAFPVLYERVIVDDKYGLLRGDPALAPHIISAAKRLEAMGVGFIAGACGSFAYYQRDVREAVRIPVFMSIMLQVPLLQMALGGGKLGVLCANASALSERVLADCGIRDTASLVIRQIAGRPEFDAMIRGARTLNAEVLRDEVLEVTKDMVRDEPDLRAFLLQCSDLPPFAADIQSATGRPVFDGVLMINWLRAATERLPFSGALRRTPTGFPGG